MSAPTPLVQLTDICQSFPTSDGLVLDRVNLTVYRGDFLAILGPSGSGKSTLLNILGLLATPTSGSYLLQGKPVSQAKAAERDRIRRETVGFIFQSSNMLLDETSLTNAAMGLRVAGIPLEERRGLALQALTEVGLEHRAHTVTKYLSGGEKQRCAIARAIAPRPTLILADEPTGNLDTHNSQRVISILKELNAAGHTVIIITHDPAIAAQAQRRASIVDGQLTEEPYPTQEEKPGHKVSHPPAPQPSPSTFLADDVREALSALTQRPIRACLLGFSFALGIGGLIASLGMSQSANHQVSQRILGSEQQIIHAMVNTRADVLGNHRTGPSAAHYTQELSQLDYVLSASYQAAVAPADTRITRFSPLEEEPDTAISLVSLDTARLQQLGVEGVDPALSRQIEAMNSSLHLSEPGERELATDLSTALITPKAAQALNLLDTSGKLPAETGIWVDGSFLPVTGLLDAGQDNPELASAVFVAPQFLTKSGHYSIRYTLETEPGYTRAVAQALPLVLAPDSPADVSTETPASLAALRAEVSSDLGLFVGILSGILLVLASLSAGTAMYLSVQARTTEIALRRAIGAGKGLIARLFLLEGLVLGVVGGCLGSAAGMGATLLLASVQGWQAVLSSSYPLLALLLGGLTGLVSALYPAWVASRKSPADAMRG